MVKRFDPSQLPLELLIDASNAARDGIRIALRDGRLTVQRVKPIPVDCLAAIVEDAPIRALEYVVVDVETTGGSFTSGHRITEIAAVRLRGDGTRTAEFRSLINPERPILPFVTALTRISWDMVKDAPRFVDVAPDIARILDGAVFVAHNAGFDWRFVRAELQRAGTTVTGNTLCTVRLAKHVVPEIRRRSLDALSYFFDIHNEARHRAYGDARATAEVLRRLLDRCDTLEVTRWQELQQLLGRRAPRRKRQANPHAATDE